jgi:hypothetical protein
VSDSHVRSVISPGSEFPRIHVTDMPFGSRVTLAIYSTWGDEYFVGLNGIEIFDSEGQALAFGRGIASVECLKGYSADDADDSQELADHDPRVVANLVNGKLFLLIALLIMAPNGEGLEPPLLVSRGVNTSRPDDDLL